MASFTDEQLRAFARQVIESAASDPDFMGVGERFEDEWAHLSSGEFDEVQERVHDLACSATVTVSWPDGREASDGA